jgi:hypothetical protein
VNYLAAADDTPTGPIPVVTTTTAMPLIKPMPPHLAVELAVLRPSLELMASRFRGLMAEIERCQRALDGLQLQLDAAVGL